MNGDVSRRTGTRGGPGNASAVLERIAEYSSGMVWVKKTFECTFLGTSRPVRWSIRIPIPA